MKMRKRTQIMSFLCDNIGKEVSVHDHYSKLTGVLQPKDFDPNPKSWELKVDQNMAYSRFQIADVVCVSDVYGEPAIVLK